MPAMPDSDTRPRRFGGVARLYGGQALSQLESVHVCVVGIGGVGSWAVEALARSGVRRLTLIDLDHVAESNVNRQIHALESTLGQAKVLAMKSRIAGIDSACEVTAVEEFVTPENVAGLLPRCDYVIDAIDQVKAKAALIAHCRAEAVPVVTTGAAGGKADPAMIRVDDLSRTTQDPLAAKLRASLRRDYGFPRDTKKNFGVECVYSLEPIRRPDGAACDVDETGLHGLSCAGYGSSVCVTAGFGFAAASRVLTALARQVGT
jgi:tRNA A37 threonylcarbamoyladenosine dehydratase